MRGRGRRGRVHGLRGRSLKWDIGERTIICGEIMERVEGRQARCARGSKASGLGRWAQAASRDAKHGTLEACAPRAALALVARLGGGGARRLGGTDGTSVLLFCKSQQPRSLSRPRLSWDLGGRRAPGLDLDVHTHLTGGAGDDFHRRFFVAGVEVRHLLFRNFQQLLFAQLADFGLVGLFAAAGTPC
jgi:hypothetical protein